MLIDILWKYRKSTLLIFLCKVSVIKRSTIDAIIELALHVSVTFENNEYGIGVILDLFKAFDTVRVEHSILLKENIMVRCQGKGLELVQKLHSG